VPSGIAAVIATIFVSFFASATRLSAKTRVNVGAFGFATTCAPVTTLNRETP
jgi:hypothetical protein